MTHSKLGELYEEEDHTLIDLFLKGGRLPKKPVISLISSEKESIKNPMNRRIINSGKQLAPILIDFVFISWSFNKASTGVSRLISISVSNFLISSKGFAMSIKIESWNWGEAISFHLLPFHFGFCWLPFCIQKQNLQHAGFPTGIKFRLPYLSMNCGGISGHFLPYEYQSCGYYRHVPFFGENYFVAYFFIGNMIIFTRNSLSSNSFSSW